MGHLLVHVSSYERKHRYIRKRGGAGEEYEGAAPGPAQRLELPEEALLGALKLTVTGGRQALVENHRGLLDYSEERILISAIKGKLAISGTGLSLAAMNKSELLVKGRIQSVEWE